MDSKLFFNQIRLQLPRMEGVAIKTEDDKLNFYVDGREEFYVSSSSGLAHEINGSYSSEKVSKIIYLSRSMTTLSEISGKLKSAGIEVISIQ